MNSFLRIEIIFFFFIFFARTLWISAQYHEKFASGWFFHFHEFHSLCHNCFFFLFLPIFLFFFFFVFVVVVVLCSLLMILSMYLLVTIHFIPVLYDRIDVCVQRQICVRNSIFTWMCVCVDRIQIKRKRKKNTVMQLCL